MLRFGIKDPLWNKFSKCRNGDTSVVMAGAGRPSMCGRPVGFKGELCRKGRWVRVRSCVRPCGALSMTAAQMGSASEPSKCGFQRCRPGIPN
jgi:hypothetical protein